MFKKSKNLTALTLGLAFCLQLSSSAINSSFSNEKLEDKVEGVQTYCLKRKENNGFYYSVFNINDNIVEINKHEEGEGYDVFINGESIRTSFFSFNGDTSDINIGINTSDINIGIYSPIELKGVTKSNWRLVELFIRRGGNIEARIVNEKGFLNTRYLGKFNKNDCSFKENPDDATERLIMWNRDDGGFFYISYPELGGHLYFNAEKSQYTIDILGTIRNTLFPSHNQVIGDLTNILRRGFLAEVVAIWIASPKEILQDLGDRLPDGKGESDFVYFNISEDYKLFLEYYMNYGPYLAIPRNFGDSQVFWVKGFENREPTLMTTPYRISADGIIYDTKKRVTLRDAVHIPKPVARVHFTVIWNFDNFGLVGYLTNLKDIN